MVRATFLTTLLSVIAFGSALGQPDAGVFSFPVAGLKITFYQEYKLLSENLAKCISDGKMKIATCKKVRQKTSRAVYDAISHAMVINGGESRPYFCHDKARAWVLDGSNEAVIFAALLIGDRIQYGASLYGRRLATTPLSKIIFDALVSEYPCK